MRRLTIEATFAQLGLVIQWSRFSACAMGALLVRRPAGYRDQISLAPPISTAQKTTALLTRRKVQTTDPKRYFSGALLLKPDNETAERQVIHSSWSEGGTVAAGSYLRVNNYERKGASMWYRCYPALEVSWVRRPPSSASVVFMRLLKAGGACSNLAGCPWLRSSA